MKLILNKAQQKAVDHIYGPLLVLAGPGTGKTQLLSARIANILQKTDVNAQNILCLTFTENAAINMRDRLTSLIGSDAYDVRINTYHGFGSDIIREYPEYFEEIDLGSGKDTRLEKPIDDLQRIQIIESIILKLPYDNPLISARHYVKNIVSTISELKRGMYTPESLEMLAKNNLKQIKDINPKISTIFDGVGRMPSKLEKSMNLFIQVQSLLEGMDGLAEFACEELNVALSLATEQNSSKPITAWKNDWLTKDSDDKYSFTDENQQLKLVELAKIYGKYQTKLSENSQYDFDDMILRTIDALKNKSELKYNLQEKYQFILLDEFQDTNAAQFELVKQLADNPVNEGQPNIFAVGDDDQAIYAFQGAKVSNMLQFTEEFRPVATINLIENYRSHPDILHVSHEVASQIESRLHYDLENVEKTLIASSTNLPKESIIERHEFESVANEYAWVANKIKELIDNGTDANEIAVLAPKHTLLEQVVPFLSHNKVPVTYEKREDILQTPLLQSYKLMIELVISAANGDSTMMSELFPKVLSLEFYQLPVEDIWKVNWTYRSGGEDRSWAEIALDNDVLAPHVLFYLALGLKASGEPLEYVLDYITGANSLSFDENTEYISPLKQYYFSERENNTLKFYESLTNLSTIREHLRSYQNSSEKILTVRDFLDFISAYESADQPLINSHPIAQSEKSVQLMTVYKAKGLEFENVFLLSVHDDVWGKKSRSNTNKLSLPANLQHVRYLGSSEDELRRILFVAITRAKHGLYLSSHTNKDNGKPTEPVKYLMEHDELDKRISDVLPTDKQHIIKTSFAHIDTMKNVELLWESRHINLDANLKSLINKRLINYQMSPTHLNTFIDLEYGGPESFLLQTLLRFPKAPGEDGEFGNAIHGSLEWYQNQISKNLNPSIASLLKEFDANLKRRYITADRIDDYRAKGHNALSKYIEARTAMFQLESKTEVDFRTEGVLVGKAHLSGKIDRIEINKTEKTLSIVDFKTGKPHTKWDREVKLIKYKQQLYFYKFLIEGSHSWSNYKVSSARLEFVEPNGDGKIVDPLYIEFDSNEEKQLKKLIENIWTSIKKLNFPETIGFNADYYGVLKYIDSIK